MERESLSEPIENLDLAEQAEREIGPDQHEFYTKTELVQLAEVRRAAGLDTVLLATDIDKTWIRHLENRSIQGLPLQAELAEQDIPVVAVTGNALANVRPRIESGELPFFPVIAGSVGTEVWLKLSEAPAASTDDVIQITNNRGEIAFYVKDRFFDHLLAERDYNRKAIAVFGQEFVAECAQLDQSATREDDRYQLSFQNQDQEEKYLADGTVPTGQEYKVSFHFFADSLEQVQRVVQAAEAKFGQRISYCQEMNYNDKLSPSETYRKYCLDVLPVTKGEVVNYLSREVVRADATLVAGDSGNDVGLLTESGDVSITVGGATPELTERIDQTITESQQIAGRGSFRRVQIDGQTKLYFRERRSEKYGPDSILYALRVLQRAERRKKN